MHIEDRDNPIMVPDLNQDQAFAIFDDFFGTSPPPPATQAPDFGDDEFANMMENLEDIEKNMQLSDSDLPMRDVIPTLHSTGLLEHASSATSPALRNAAGASSDQHPQTSSLPKLPMHDMSPSLHVAKPIDIELPAASPAIDEMAHEAHDHTPSLSELPMQDAPPSNGPLKAAKIESSLNTPDLALRLPKSEKQRSGTPTLRKEQYPQTPAQSLARQMMGSPRGGSTAPSSSGHRSSMQGEMRQEEEELSNGDLGSLPPFPGFLAGGDGQIGNAIDSPLAADHREGMRDLSSSRDIGRQTVTASAKSFPGQEAATPLLSLLRTAPPGSIDPAIRPAALQGLKRGRNSPPPRLPPGKKTRHLSPEPSYESPQPTASRSVNHSQFIRIEESDSSLTDLSLTELLSTSPAQINEQVAPFTQMPPRDSPHRRKDSFASSLREFKAEEPSSPVKYADVAEAESTKPKTTPKKKRNDAHIVTSSPASTKASPALAKGTKVTKPSGKTKAKQPTPIKNDLRGIIEAGVLRDVLKNKGPRQTRGQHKATESIKPDAASAAKGRHTRQVNYKE